MNHRENRFPFLSLFGNQIISLFGNPEYFIYFGEKIDEFLGNLYIAWGSVVLILFYTPW